MSQTIDQSMNEGEATATSVLGRPTKYKTEYDKLAYNFCLLGATDGDLAKALDVNEDTINEWKKVNPSFSESLKAGKDEADAQVAQSLFHRATGYEHPDLDLKMYEGQIIKTEIIKHYPPDTTAAIFWLKNRNKDKWRDKSEVDQHNTGNLTVELVSYEDAASDPHTT